MLSEHAFSGRPQLCRIEGGPLFEDIFNVANSVD